MSIVIRIVLPKNDILVSLDITKVVRLGFPCEYVLYLLGMILDHLMSIMIRTVSARNDILLPLDTTRPGTYRIAL